MKDAVFQELKPEDGKRNLKLQQVYQANILI